MAEQEFKPATDYSIIAQSVFAQSSAASGLDFSSEIIVLMPYSDIAEYQGTRSALEDEGVIPVGTKWPSGFDDLRWEDDQFSYRLRRERPEGAKGQRKQFLEVDWWMLRFRSLKTEPFEMRIIHLKAKELADAIYRQSAKGRAEHSKQCSCYWEAKKDDKFQAFKSLIPGINRPKRGRKPKSSLEANDS